MGKFSSHLKLVSQQTSPCSFTSLEYAFVDYPRLAALANECSDASAFREAWEDELVRSSANFDEHYRTASGIMIDGVFDALEGAEGPSHPALASPDPRAAVGILMEHKGRDFVLDLLKDFRTLLQAASLNAEALHLALKKYDKRAAAAAEKAGKPAPKTGMMRELLPKLYSSTTYHATGTRTLIGDVEVVRHFLERDEKEGGGAPDELSDAPAVVVGAKRLSETAEDVREDDKWFMENTKALEARELEALVAHRGFHCEKDDSVSRPIENSLTSFE